MRGGPSSAGRLARTIALLHRGGWAVLLGGLAVVLVATATTAVLHVRTEQRLLDQQTNEAGAVLGAAVLAVRRPLAAAAELAEATDGDPEAFAAVLGSLVGEGDESSFAAAVLFDGATAEPVAALGGPTVLSNASPSRRRAVLNTAANATDLAIVDLLDLPGRRIGYTLTSYRQQGRFVVYAEARLPQERLGAPRVRGPFDALEYALYLGRDEQDARLLYASVDEVPIVGRRASTVVPIGEDELELVATTREQLGGTLSRLLPWWVAGSGTALAVGAAVMTERLVRRRQRAELLADQVSTLLAQHQERNEILQRSLLPRQLPQPPGLDVVGRYWPAHHGEQVGGDFYDLFPVAPGRWALTIGDVCGKGIEAARLTALSRHTIRAAARHLVSPAEVLRWVHEAIRADESETFCTACFGFLTWHDDGRLSLELSLGGHPQPLLQRNGELPQPLGVHGTVLGFVDPNLSVSRYELHEDDMLVLYTDGVTDAPAGQALDDAAFAEMLGIDRDEPLSAIAERLSLAMTERRTNGSGDDTALLLLRVRGVARSVGGYQVGERKVLP